MLRTRPRSVLTLSFLLAAASVSSAAAQSAVTVSTGYADAHRHVLEVTDLTGTTLTELALTPGTPRTFRVGVRTSAPTLLAAPATALDGYSVESSMTNLYPVAGGNPVYTGTAIPSSEVTLGYATSPLEVRDALGRVSPDYVLSTVTGGIDCTAIATATGLSVLDLATNPTCTLLGSLTGALTFSNVPLAGSVIDGIDLSSLLPSQLPLVPQAGVDAGAFTLPDCLNGVGAGDTAGCTSGTSGTNLTMLKADEATAVATELVSKIVAPTPLASADGSAAKASLAQVLAAMQLASDANVSSFANRLVQDFSATDQLKIVNAVLEAGAPVISGLDDVIGFSALNNAFPSLTVTPSEAKSGSFTGTLTVRLVECPACP